MAVDRRNSSENASQHGGHFPSSNIMPAWVPAASVAIGMIIFLAASFYLRHRKVMKKRQILMDYFYIIFQYGETRRKRMMTALCNTNAITLRQLGRSFMISFDSVANMDNSCPFFLDDSAFATNQSSSSFTRKPLFRSKSRSGGGNRLRPSHLSSSPTSLRDPPTRLNPTGFQEIKMKFKSKKPPTGSPDPSMQNTSRLMPPKVGSMCSIHDDDPATHISSLENYEQYSRIRERRNAYVGSYDSIESTIDELEKSPLPQPILDHFQQQLSRDRRSSEPKHCDTRHVKIMSKDGTKVYGTRVLYPGVERVDSESGVVYRSSEPAIMIHSASNDFGSSFDLEDSQNKCPNGLIFIKEVTSEDGSVQRYYMNERPPPSFNQSHRNSLSKVSYVPSGNMNEYYSNINHSLQSPARSKPNEDSTESKTNEKTKSGGWSWKKSGSKKVSQIDVPVPTPSRRGRLSLGDIAVSNFNRRIVDFPSESLGSTLDIDEEPGGIYHKSSSKDSSNKTPTTWKRLKNVFSGSKSSQSSSETKSKSSKSKQESDERAKRNMGRRQHGRWNKFVNVITGFRSLTEFKRPRPFSLEKKNCTSLPMGLDWRMPSGDDFDFRRRSHTTSLDFHNGFCSRRQSEHMTFYDRLKRKMTSTSTSRPQPHKTRSFPDDMRIIHHEPNMLFTCRKSPNKTMGNLRLGSRKQKRKHTSVDSYPRPKSYGDVFKYFSRNQASSHSFGDDCYNYIPCPTLSTVSTPRSQSPNCPGNCDFDGLSFKVKLGDSEPRSPKRLPEPLFDSNPPNYNGSSVTHSTLNTLVNNGRLIQPISKGNVDALLPENFPKNSEGYRCVSSNASGPMANRSCCTKPILKNLHSYPGDSAQYRKWIDGGHVFVGDRCIPNIHRPPYRHSISGPTCGDNVQSINELSSKLSESDKRTTLSENQKVHHHMLNVNQRDDGSSMDSVYFDTVSSLGSPSTPKQTTVLNIPLDANANNNTGIFHTPLEAAPLVSYSNTNSDQSTMQYSDTHEGTKPNNDFNVTMIHSEFNENANYELSQSTPQFSKQVFDNVNECSHVSNTPCIATLTDESKKRNSSLSQSTYPSADTQTFVLDNMPSQFTPPSTFSTTKTSQESHLLSYTSTDVSLEHQSSTSSRASCNSNSSKEYQNQASDTNICKDYSLSDIESNLVSNASLGCNKNPDSDGQLQSVEVEDGASETPSENSMRNLELTFPSKESATFRMVSETERKQSPEEAAIFNFTRLPRFGRRTSQCSPSSISDESRDGSLPSGKPQFSASASISTPFSPQEEDIPDKNEEDSMEV